jgi:hypothetical protein
MPFKWKLPVLGFMKLATVAGTHPSPPNVEPLIQADTLSLSSEQSPVDSAISDLSCNSTDMTESLFSSLRNGDYKKAIDLARRSPNLLNCYENDLGLTYSPIIRLHSMTKLNF